MNPYTPGAIWEDLILALNCDHENNPSTVTNPEIHPSRRGGHVLDTFGAATKVSESEDQQMRVGSEGRQ